jgi:Mrp family chromosome partitioning ATPase
MARIRETLRQADLVRDQLPASAPLASSGLLSQDAPSSNSTPEIPFIEVGAPGTPLEASPGVLAMTPRARQAQQVPRSTPQCGRTGITLQTLPLEAPPLLPVAERFAPELVAFHQPEERAGEQYRVLVADLERQLRAGQPHVLLFTAARPATDTATVLLNLAITRARQGRGAVVVVDAQLPNAVVAQRLGLPLVPGLHDVLAGRISLQRAVVETGQAGLYALTAGKAQEESPGLLAGEAMRAILRHLRLRFEWVLVAGSHWDGRPNLVALGSACDAVYLVHGHAEANSAEVQELLQIIPQQGICLRGCIYLEP